MRTITTLSLAAVLSGLTAANAQQLKVGVFNTRAVALAFYNSDHWAGVMKSKHAERAAAKAAGDTARIAELEKWGQDQQDLAHKQVFGDAPIPNVLDYLAPSLPAVAQGTGVSLITTGTPYAAPSIQKVDITLQLIEVLKPSARTRALVSSFLEKNPPPTNVPHAH